MKPWEIIQRAYVTVTQFPRWWHLVKLEYKITTGRATLTRESPDLTQTPFLHVLMCVRVYLMLCSFPMCTDSCNYHQSHHREPCHHYKAPRFTHYSPSTCLPSPPWQPLICSLSNFVISRSLCKQNHALGNLLRLAFLLSIISLRSIQADAYYQ